MSNPSCIPATLVAGDSWAWSEIAPFASYPPPDWSLICVLRPVSDGTAIEITSEAGAGAFNFSLGASVTATAAPGAYEWSLLAYGPNDARVWLGSGRLAVLPDPATAAGDLRSSAERILDAINATLEGRATKDADAFTIEGRSITRTPLPDLLKLQALYERKVRAERNPGGSLITYRRVRL